MVHVIVRKFWIAGLLSLAMTASCTQAVTVAYYNRLGDMEVNGDTGAAVSKVRDARDVYGNKGRLQYLMDLGMALFLDNQFKQSNAVLSQAEVLVENLYTRHVSAYTASLFSSDLALPFRGEPFEQAYINVIKMMNYLKLGSLKDALIEARRAEKRINFAATLNKKLRFRNDPFIHYMAGLMYQFSGQYNDALISYKNAIKFYTAQERFFEINLPRALPGLAILCAQRIGDTDTVNELGSRFPNAMATAEKFRDKRLVVLVQLAGLAPVKGERFIEITVGHGLAYVQSWDVENSEQDKVRQVISAGKSMSGRNITIALPIYHERGEAIGPACMIAGDDKVCARSVDDLDMVARACLEDEMPRIMARTIARAVVKFIMAETARIIAQKASKKSWVGLLAGLTAQAVMSVLEHADTRVWGTLPAVTRLGVMPVAGDARGNISVQVGDEILNNPACYPKNSRDCFILLRTP